LPPGVGEVGTLKGDVSINYGLSGEDAAGLARAIAEPEPDALQLVERAEAALARGALELARRELEQAIGLDDQIPAAYAHLALVHMKSGDPVASMRAWADLVRTGADLEPFEETLIDLKIDLPDDMQVLVKVFQAAPLRIVQERMLEVAVEDEVGIEETLEAIARSRHEDWPPPAVLPPLEPETAETAIKAASFELAECFKAAGKRDLAVEHYHRTLTLGASSAQPLIAIAEKLYWLDDRDGSRATYERALEIEPDNEIVAACLLRLDYTEEFEFPLDGSEGRITLRLTGDKALQARLHQHMGRAKELIEAVCLDEAEAELRKILAVDENWAAAYQGMGLVMWARGDRDSAQRWLESVVELNPECDEARDLLERMESTPIGVPSVLEGDVDPWTLFGNIGAHWKAIDESTRAGNVDHELLQRLGVVLAQAGRGMVGVPDRGLEDILEEALGCCETVSRKRAVMLWLEALALDPSCVPALGNLGMTFFLGFWTLSQSPHQRTEDGPDHPAFTFEFPTWRTRYEEYSSPYPERFRDVDEATGEHPLPGTFDHEDRLKLLPQIWSFHDEIIRRQYDPDYETGHKFRPLGELIAKVCRGVVERPQASIEWLEEYSAELSGIGGVVPLVFYCLQILELDPMNRRAKGNLGYLHYLEEYKLHVLEHIDPNTGQITRELKVVFDEFYEGESEHRGYGDEWPDAFVFYDGEWESYVPD
jgi:tetratricopeptide (TPR) repeat protein